MNDSLKIRRARAEYHLAEAHVKAMQQRLRSEEAISKAQLLLAQLDAEDLWARAKELEVEAEMLDKEEAA